MRTTHFIVTCSLMILYQLLFNCKTIQWKPTNITFDKYKLINPLVPNISFMRHTWWCSKCQTCICSYTAPN